MTDPRELAGRTWEGVTALLEALDEIDLTRPSLCAGWAVVDVLHHLQFDLVRALTACASPVDAVPTVDAATYWQAWSAAADPVQEARGVRSTRIQAAAYRGPEGLLALWRDTAPAAQRALLARRPDERVATQGHVITVNDLARSLVVEATVHHLDCLPSLGDVPRPSAESVVEVRRTAEQVLATPLPPGNDESWALKAAGRVPLSPGDRSALGDAARAFPLLG
ncbi:MAG TPA: maleylpyruvate isomerase N-terminal domain-containing protein [Mycobacteriales bacterium]|nr:maleylpyruvate isomerase N-terminal domain-containing protein [Mycobacteriales bacterium]